MRPARWPRRSRRRTSAVRDEQAPEQGGIAHDIHEESDRVKFPVITETTAIREVPEQLVAPVVEAEETVAPVAAAPVETVAPTEEIASVIEPAAPAITAQVATTVVTNTIAQPEPVHSEPATAVKPVEVVVTKPSKARRRSGIVSNVHFAQAEMTLPPSAPELPVKHVEYPPFERQAVQVSGRKASITDLRSVASAPMTRP